jgi:hypothetical protein
MSLPDIAGILSRYFVIGFFLPVFFTLMIVTQAVSAGFPLPNVYQSHSEGARVLIVGGVALLFGLLLSGFRYVIDSAFAGLYFVPRPGSRLTRLLEPWTRLVLRSQTLTFRRYIADRDSDRHPERRQPAAWHLDRRFPQAESRLLPTPYGNTMRATADYAWSRWGLDLEAVEERIALLMSDGERDEHTDARTDLAFSSMRPSGRSRSWRCWSPTRSLTERSIGSLRSRSTSSSSSSPAPCTGKRSPHSSAWEG